MKFILNQTCDRIIPLDEVRCICLMDPVFGIRELYHLDVLMKDNMRLLLGTFKTRQRAEYAMEALLNMLEDRFWAGIIDDDKVEAKEEK